MPLSSSVQAAEIDGTTSPDQQQSSSSLDTFEHVFIFGDTGSCCHLLDQQENGGADNGGEESDTTSTSTKKMKSTAKAAALVQAGPSGWRQL